MDFIMDKLSMYGYRDDSPYRRRKRIKIKGDGLIDMSATGIPLRLEDEAGNVKFVAPYSGLHQMEGDVMETPLAQGGGQFKRASDIGTMGLNRQKVINNYQGKIAEQQTQIGNNYNQQLTTVRATPSLNPYEQQQKIENKANKNQQYAAENPKFNSVNGELELSPYGNFMDKYGKSVDKTAEGLGTALEIQGALSGVGALGKFAGKKALESLTKGVLSKRIPTITRGPINWWQEPNYLKRNPGINSELVNKHFSSLPVDKPMGQIPLGRQPYLRDTEMEIFKNWMRNQQSPQKMGIGLEDIKNFFTKPKYSKKFKISESDGIPHIEYKGQKIPIKSRFTLPDGSKRNVVNTFSAYGNNPSHARTIFGITDDTGNYSTFYKSSGTNSGKVKGQIYPIEGFADKAFVGKHGQIDNWFIKGLKGEYRLPEGHPARGYSSKEEFDISKYLESKFPNSPYEIAQSNPKGFPTVTQDVPGAGNFAQKFFNNKLPYEMKDNPSIVGNHAIWQNNPIQNKEVFNPISERLPDWRKIVPIGGAAVGSAVYNITKKKQQGGYVNPYNSQDVVSKIIHELYYDDNQQNAGAPLPSNEASNEASNEVDNTENADVISEVIERQQSEAEQYNLAILYGAQGNPYSEDIPVNRERTVGNPYTISKESPSTPPALFAGNQYRQPEKYTGNSSQSKLLYVKNRLLSEGLPENQVKGILANLIQESGNFRDDVISGKLQGDNNTSLGIAQWRGPRKKALINFAQERGMNPYTLEAQTEFLIYELKGMPKVFNKLMSAKSAEEATKTFNYHYEVSADSRHDPNYRLKHLKSIP